MAIFRPLSRRHPFEPGSRLDDGSSAVPFRRIVQVKEAQDRRQLLARQGRAGFTGFIPDNGSSDTAPQVRRIVTVRGLRETRPGQVAFTGFIMDDGSSEVARPATLIQDLTNRIRRGYVRLGQQIKDEPAPETGRGGRITRVQDLAVHHRPGAIYWIPQLLDDGTPPDKAGWRPTLSREAFDRARLLKQGKVLWGSQILDDGTSDTPPAVRRIHSVNDPSPINRLLPRGGRVIWAKSVRPDIDEPQLNRRVFRIQDLMRHYRSGAVYHLAGAAREAGVATISPGCLTISDELVTIITLTDERVTTITLSDERVTTITLSDDCQ